MRLPIILLLCFCAAPSVAQTEPVRTHLPNGNLATCGQMVQEQRHGQWEFYTEQGVLWIRAIYQCGVLQSAYNALESSPEQASRNRLLPDHGLPADHPYWRDQWYRHQMLYSEQLHPFQTGAVYVMKNVYQRTGKARRKKSDAPITIEHLITDPNNPDSETIYAKDEVLLSRTYRMKHLKRIRSDIFRDGHPYAMLQLPKIPGIEIQQPVYQGVGNWYATAPNGDIFNQIEVSHGKAHGDARWFHPNGKVAVRGRYVNGRRHGEWEGYYPNGSVLWRYNYRNDTIHGRFSVFHPNQQPYLVANIASAFDPVLEYDAVLAGLHFSNLKLHGALSIYDEAGKVVFETAFPREVPFAYRRTGSLPEQVLSPPLLANNLESGRLSRWLWNQPKR